jgi:hypothetical protein
MGEKKAVFTAAALALALLAGCAGGGARTEDRQTRPRTGRDRLAMELYRRSEAELERGEYAPALSDIVHAGELARSSEVKGVVASRRADIVNHLQIYTTIEESAILRYTVAYNRENVFYPVGNLNVRFTFLEGKGILVAPAGTDENGTASGRIEKITSFNRRIVIEAVPVFSVEDEIVRVAELKRDFVLSRKQTLQKPESGGLVDFIESILDDIFNWEVTP